VNFILIMDDDLNVAGLNPKLDSYSVGPAGQIGCDVKLADRWTLNFDVKRAMLRSDVKVNGTEIAEVRLEPWLYSIGLEYAF
ncbi:MAG: OmpW family protein, partial [Verrucomicrobia bacterium]